LEWSEWIVAEGRSSRQEQEAGRALFVIDHFSFVIFHFQEGLCRIPCGKPPAFRSLFPNSNARLSLALLFVVDTESQGLSARDAAQPPLEMENDK